MSRDRTVPDIRKAEENKYSQTSKLGFFERLRDRANSIVWRAHLGDNFIQPLEGAVQVNFDPTGSGRHILAVVFSAPT